MIFPATAIEDIAAHIRETGSCVVRGAYPVDKLAKFRAAIVGYTELRRSRRAQALPLDRMLDTHGAGSGYGLIKDGFLTPADFQDLFFGSVYARICAAYFGDDRLYTQLNRNGFRNHDPSTSSKSYIPYHQDSYSQDPRVQSILNSWTPLDPAGRDAPGLEVVRNPCIPNFPRKEWGLESNNAAYDKITIEREKIVEFYGENFAAPELAVGDCLIFSENVIHRTYVTPEMVKPRINLEFRVFSQGSIKQSDVNTPQAINALPLRWKAEP